MKKDDFPKPTPEQERCIDTGLPLGNCRACRHWRMKAEVKKAWGVCDNPKNEVLVSLRPQLGGIISDDLIHKLENLEDNIRYPEDFGCIFFESK